MDTLDVYLGYNNINHHHESSSSQQNNTIS